MMNEHGKSDSGIVSAKWSNKEERANKARSSAEVMEKRLLAKGNSTQQTTSRTQGRAKVQRALGRIRHAAKQDKKQRFTALMHHIYDVDTLRESYFSLKRAAAAGVDGMTWE